MEVTLETLQGLTQTMSTTSGAQLFTVMFFGIIAVVALVWLMWFIMGIRFRSVDKLEERLEKLEQVLTDIGKKMWAESTLDNKIECAINRTLLEHERKYHSSDVK